MIDTDSVTLVRRSRAAAIAAKCRDCTYDECERGTWRQQVAQCAIVECALHPFRPLPR